MAPKKATKKKAPKKSKTKAKGKTKAKAKKAKAPKAKAAKKSKGPVFVSRNQEDIRCPRCGANNTRALRTCEEIQYRICVRPICRRRFIEPRDKV